MKMKGCAVIKNICRFCLHRIEYYKVKYYQAYYYLRLVRNNTGLYVITISATLNAQ